jgi:hypothetical protein
MTNVRDFAFRKCLGTLPLRYRRRLFLDLAKTLGVSKIRIKGEYGDISGFIDDNQIFGLYLRHGVWSEHINAIFVDYFSGGTSGTFLDIGANIGLTTIPVARNRHIFCHAFEPDPDNFDLLQENVRRAPSQRGLVFGGDVIDAGAVYRKPRQPYDSAWSTEAVLSPSS